MKKFINCLCVMVLAFGLMPLAGTVRADAAETGHSISDAFNVSFDTQYTKVWNADNKDASCLNKVTLPERGLVNLTMTKPVNAKGKNQRVDVTVYSEKGETVAGASLGRNDDSILDTYSYAVYLDKGTYYFDLKVSALISKFSKDTLETVYSFSFGANANAEAEPNNTLSQANIIANGQMYDALFGRDHDLTTDEDDYFKFEAAAGDKVTVKIGGFAALESAKAAINVILPDNTEKSIIDAAKADISGNAEYTFTADTSGVYMIHLDSYIKEGIPYKVGYTSSGSSEKAVAVKAGDSIKYNKNTYKVISPDKKTVAFSKARSDKKAVTVPPTIKYKGKTYKVTTVNAGAFKAKKITSVTIGKNVKKIKAKAFNKSNAKTVTLKTKLLKKAVVKNSLKGSKVSTIKVRITKKASKTNKTYVKKYKGYFTKANAGRKVKVK